MSGVREASRQMTYPWPGAFFLTDPGRVPDPVAVIASLPPGTGVIYRHFGADDRVKTATRLRAATHHRHLPLLIANDPQLACQTGADGVHWPETQAHKARQWQGRFLFQTQSAHSRSALFSAVCEGILYSAVFPSNSPSAGSPIGATRFRALIKGTKKQVYALGGINGGTAGAVSPFAGLAAIDSFLPVPKQLDR